jgi:hypothetical protein
MKNETEHGPIGGNLQIWMIDEEGKNKIMIYGDPEGLKSLGEVLIKLAEVDQESYVGLPDGERDHLHIYPGFHLSDGSLETILGRLDAKGTGKFPKAFVGINDENHTK